MSAQAGAAVLKPISPLFWIKVFWIKGLLSGHFRRDHDRIAGDAARDRRDWTAAAASYRRHLAKRPTHTAVWLRLGNMFKESGQFEEAERAYSEVSRLTPDSGAGPRMRAELSRRQGDLVQACRHYLEAWRRDRDLDAGFHLTRVDLISFLASEQSRGLGTHERITGAVDGLRGLAIEGWAWNPDRPADPVALNISVGGRLVGQARADLVRSDIVGLGLSEIPNCGFSFDLGRYIKAGDALSVDVELVDTKAPLAASPFDIDAMRGLARWLERAVAPPSETGEPMISIITPVHDVDPDWFAETVQSVFRQTDGSWRWIIVDDGSSNADIKELLRRTAAQDDRVTLIANVEPRGTAAAINVGLTAAVGEYVLFLDHDDRLEPEAIRQLSYAASSGADIVYGDEAITGRGLSDLRSIMARPAFSWRYYLSHPYFVHPICVRRALASAGWDETLPASADIDFVLRMIEAAQLIAHQPGILYRWRTHENSSGHRLEDKVTGATVGAIGRHLDRMGVTASVTSAEKFNTYRLDTQDTGGRVLVIIPTKDRADLLRQCLSSLFSTCKAEDLDIVVIDHDSRDPELAELLADLAHRVRVMPFSGPFNYSRMNNLAVSAFARGHRFVLFLNNDIEALDAGWIERLRALAGQEDVGVVGPILIYPDSRIQHAGVFLGPGGYAEHAMKFEPLIVDGRRNPGYNCSLTAVRDWSAVTGACLMMRTDVFLSVGGFDEDLAVGFNDTDLCLRVREQGLNVIVDGWTVLRHHESVTRASSGQLAHPEDAAGFAKRWAGLIAAGDPYYNPMLSLYRDHRVEHPDVATPDYRLTRSFRKVAP
jgi:GT2 family glycosyltransferase